MNFAVARELNKVMEHESNSDTNHYLCTRFRIGTGIGGHSNKRTSEEHPNYSIVKIGHNTEKSPGDLRRLVVTQTPVRNHQLMLVWKILKEVGNNEKNMMHWILWDLKTKTDHQILARIPGSIN